MKVNAHLPLLLLTLFTCSTSRTQDQKNAIVSVYDHALDFDESDVDSLVWAAAYIEKEARKTNLPEGYIYALRLKGIHAEYNEEYDSAASYYLASLAEAKRLKNELYEGAALSDLAILYSNIKQPEKAMEMYRKNLELVEKRQEASGLINTYTNMGALYNILQQYDSALYVLNKAREISGRFSFDSENTTLYNNLGNVFFKLEQYDSAQYYFRSNLKTYMTVKNEPGIWVTYLNLADLFIEKEKFDSAETYANLALKTAIQLGSSMKEADSYAIIAKMYERRNSYPEAYTYLQKWYSLDTALINSETTRRIADMQEKYNAAQREKENNLLMAQLEANRQRQKSMTILVVALCMIAGITGFAFITKRKANLKLAANNKLILEKNEKLAQLNQEKNGLISIVSHDLSSPFVNIMMWGQILGMNETNLELDQRKALQRILQSAQNGEKLIRNILDIEKAETNHQILQLEKTDLHALFSAQIENFGPKAKNKNIALRFHTEGTDFVSLTDERLVNRIIENLLSNAIKFSPSGSAIDIHLSGAGEKTNRFIIKDEGVGIPPYELPHIFTKYSRISSEPTAGEASTGLGLSIVKRLVQELNGSIVCESVPGKGTSFTVTL